MRDCGALQCYDYRGRVGPATTESGEHSYITNANIFISFVTETNYFMFF